jgi:hypothetical protein
MVIVPELTVNPLLKVGVAFTVNVFVAVDPIVVFVERDVVPPNTVKPDKNVCVAVQLLLALEDNKPVIHPEGIEFAGIEIGPDEMVKPFVKVGAVLKVGVAFTVNVLVEFVPKTVFP